MRVRLVGLLDDFSGSADICFRAFSGIAIYSQHVEAVQETISRLGLRLNGGEAELYDELLSKKHQSKELGSHEIEQLKDFHSRTQIHGEIVHNTMFGDISEEFSKDRVLAENVLKVGVRSFLISCRALQDAIYSLYLISGNKTLGKHSSMNKISNGKSDISIFMSEHCRGYRDWFLAIRDLRNLVKIGTTCGVGLGSINAKVSFDDARDDRVVKVGGNDFTLSDLVESIRMTGEAIKAIVGKSGLQTKP